MANSGEATVFDMKSRSSLATFAMVGAVDPSIGCESARS